jgi:hypothetical protein
MFKSTAVAMAAGLVAAASAFGAQTAHAGSTSAQGLAFHYGVVPAEVVLAHPGSHAEREMHGGARRGESHIVLALFDANDQRRIADADVSVHIALAGGSGVTRKLEPMTIAGMPGFGAFVSMGVPGVYRIRFDVRRPGVPGVATAQFEHRVARGGNR